MYAHCTILASQYGALSNLSPTLKPPTKSKVELEPDRPLSKQSSRDLLALPSQHCGSCQKSAGLSIGDRVAPELSGLVISFGKTLPYLPQKTVTRRAWKDGHASKFANAFALNKLVQAFDKDRRYGGKQIGWCRLLCAPYKEQLSAMPDEDLIAEGGMCQSIGEFVGRYFKGDSSLVVWVIRFEFIPDLEAYTNRSPLRDVSPAFEGAASSNSTLISPIESMQQTSLLPFGVYPVSEKQTNTSSPIHARSESIHQDSLVPVGVYPALEKQTNINSPIISPIESIHQDSLKPLGVYQPPEKQNNTSSPILSRIDSIHQDSLNPLGVYQPPEKQNNINSPISSLAESIHQDSLVTLGVYPGSEKQTNTNSPISSLAESIHQAPLSPFGVYPASEKQTNTNSPILSISESIHQAPLEALPTLNLSQLELPRNNTKSPIVSATESIPQTPNEKLDGCSGDCDSSDTNPAITTAPESTNTSPTVQGGSGLIYSFWKGESIVNHYRYKVKIGGKWKVKSIYIPVGKLPQVKEAIANKLGVTVIVLEILCKKL